MSVKRLQNSDNILFDLNEDKEYAFTNIIIKYKEKKREVLNSNSRIIKNYGSKKEIPIKSDLKYLNDVIIYSNILDKEKNRENTFDSINDSRRSGFGGFKFSNNENENIKNEEIKKIKQKQCHTCKIKNNFKQVHIYNIININNNIIIEQ